MNLRRILPASQAVLIDKSGRATQPFYDFMRRLDRSESSGASVDAPFVTFQGDPSLPNARRIEAGRNIDLDTSMAGRLVVHTTASTRYLLQSEPERYWSRDELSYSTNIIGVRYPGPATVFLPSNLPTERIIVIKDETGVGQITVRVN